MNNKIFKSDINGKYCFGVDLTRDEANNIKEELNHKGIMEDGFEVFANEDRLICEKDYNLIICNEEEEKLRRLVREMILEGEI